MPDRAAAKPRVAANLIVGRDGSTSLGGSSAGLSFPADRQRFYELRQEFSAILIGGHTARNEPYANTPLPLIVITHEPLPARLQRNSKAMAWDLPLATAVARAEDQFGDLLFECGPALLRQAIAEGLIHELYLTIAEKSGGEGAIDLSELTRGAIELSNELVAGGQFLHYRLAPSHD